MSVLVVTSSPWSISGLDQWMSSDESWCPPILSRSLYSTWKKKWFVIWPLTGLRKPLRPVDNDEVIEIIWIIYGSPTSVTSQCSDNGHFWSAVMNCTACTRPEGGTHRTLAWGGSAQMLKPLPFQIYSWVNIRTLSYASSQNTPLSSWQDVVMGPQMKCDAGWVSSFCTPLTLSLLRVINFKFLLQCHKKYEITQHGELGFS